MDRSELEEHPVIAWMFEHYDEEENKKLADEYDDKDLPDGMRLSWFKHKIMSTILAPASPICLHGEAEGGSCGAVKDPNGNYWLQGGPLTQEKTLHTLRMLQETADEINGRDRSEAAE
jgi:hypothetical protein